ncbi:MAG: DUF4123 domain-containing protein [Pseudomonadota bacterium]
MATEVLADLEPLDAQFGVYPPSDVPERLEDAVFGGPANTYVVLDAASLSGFHGPDAADAMEAASLFEGDADPSNAPCLVQVGPGSRFLRRLFTRGDAPWDHFDDAAFVILRSAAPFAEVRAHLRRFTKCPDETGVWFYLRFFAPDLLDALMERLRGDASRLPRWFEMPKGARIDAWITVDAAEHVGRVHSPIYDATDLPPQAPFRLDDTYREVLEDLQDRKLIDRINAALRHDIGLPDGTDAARDRRITGDCIRLARSYGLLSERALAHVAGVGHLRGGALGRAELDSLGWFDDATIHPNARARHLFDWVRKGAATP